MFWDHFGFHFGTILRLCFVREVVGDVSRLFERYSGAVCVCVFHLLALF